MGIDDITKLFEKYGIIGGIVILLILLFAFLIKTTWFSGVLTKISDKFLEKFMRDRTVDTTVVAKVITESDIINHDVFNYIDFWKYSKVPTLQFSTEYRTVVFRKYLSIFLNSYKTNLKDFLIKDEYKKMDDAQIWKAFLDLINRIIYDYERDMVDMGLPAIIIEKMKAKNNDTISLIIDLIEGICSSQFYHSENNYLKVYSILNIVLSVLENTIHHSEGICNGINGALSGLSFTDGGRIVTEPKSKH